MDAGPIWGYRTFALPADPPRKSSLYNGAVTDAAIELVHEVVAKAADPLVPAARAGLRRPGRARPAAAADAPGRPRVLLVRPDRPTSCAGSGPPTAPQAYAPRSPGPRSRSSTPIPARGSPGEPGTVLQRSQGAVLVRTGDGSVWIGHARLRDRGPAEAAGQPGPGPTCSATYPRSPIHGRLPGDQLPPDRSGRRAHLRLLQRGDVHRPVRAAGRRTAARHRPGHPGAGRARRRGLLQRHPPQRDRGRARTRQSRRGTTSRPSTTSAARSSAAPVSWS